MAMSAIEINDEITNPLTYNAQYRALICRACKYTLNSGAGVAKHLRIMHKSLDLQGRRKLMAYANGLNIVDREAIVVPDKGCMPIDGLRLSDGFECQSCGNVRSSEASIVEHCRKQHNWVKANGVQWDECKIQTFLPMNQGGYFIVAMTEGNMDQRMNISSIDEYITGMLDKAKEMDLEEDKQLAIVDINQHTVDKSGLGLGVKILLRMKY